MNYENFFDIIVSQHHILHCFDINHTFTKLKKLIKQNGKIIFMNEISIKPWRSIPYIFWDEIMFTKILKKEFSKKWKFFVIVGQMKKI